MDGLSIAKIIVFAYIILSPFIDYKHLTILNTLIVKVIFLIVIICMSFVDLQLAILTTLAFLILLINLNRVPAMAVTKTEPYVDIISEFPDVCSDAGEIKNMNQSLVDLYIDPRVKPYEEYIKKLSTTEQIENASGHFL